MNRFDPREFRSRTPWLQASLLALALVTSSGPAYAYWELSPELDAGLIWEENPRYIGDSAKETAEDQVPGITDAVTGTFVETRLNAIYRTSSDTFILRPRMRSTDYLKANEDLNYDDWSIDVSAAHEDRRGGIGLSGSYGEISVRTGEFASATPENPNAPPESGGGSGRYSGNATQKSRNIRPYLSYNLSPRNVVRLNFNSTDITYDEPQGLGEFAGAQRGYFDYDYNQTALAVDHFLDEKNFLQLSFTGNAFDSQQPNGPFRNSSDSFGLNVGYNRAITPTLTANATVGTTRTATRVSGLPVDPLTGAPCPLTALCSETNDARNFIGDVGIRRRSERTTLNFNLSRSIAPRSSGREVVQDQVRLFVDRSLTQRLSGSVGAIYSRETGVANVLQVERDYLTIDTTLSWSLTRTLTTYAKYTYVYNEDSLVGSSNFQQTNHRLYFGVSYRGVGIRR